MIKIVKKNNSLYISPCIDGLKKELSFKYSHKEKKKVSFFSRKLGKMIERLVDGPIKSEIVDLFVHDEEKDMLVTYAGLEQRLIEFLDGAMQEYKIVEAGIPMPKPCMENWIFDGLHLDQQNALQTMLSHGGGCMLEAATSAGKTYVIAGLCRAYTGHRGLIVTNRQTVASRLYDSLKKLCPKSNIGIYTSGKKVDGDTMIITAATLKNYDPSEIGYIVYDECHGASGTVRSEDLFMFNRSVRYGVSATIINDFNGMHNYLEAIFGPIVYRTTDSDVEDYGRASPLDIYLMNVDTGMIPDPKTQDLTMEKNGIWYNRHRNNIIKECCELTPDDQQLIIFVRTKYHLDHLKSFYLPDFDVYHGKLTQKEKNKTLDGFNSGKIKRIISTDSLAEGVDPSALFVTINANWMQSNVSVVQKAGRNRRLADGKSHGIVIDFNDMWDPRFERKAKNKISKYYNRGYTIIENAKPNLIKFCKT